MRTVNAGDLAAAQKAYTKFSESPAGELVRAHPNGRLAATLKQVGEALQSGDIGQAQRALASIRPRAQAGATPATAAPSISPAGEDAPGKVLNVTA